MKNVKVSDKTWERLMMLKLKRREKSINDLIEKLLEKWTEK